MSRLLDVLNSAGEFLHQKGSPSSRLDAEVLLAEILKMQRIELYANYDRPLSEKELALYRRSVARRAKLEPVAYIIGYKEFFSRRFTVIPDVLIPRPETELLVEKVIGYVETFKIPAPRILDLCTGQGAIAITLALEIPSAALVGTEISKKALEVAKKNAENLNAEVEFVLGDLFAEVTGDFDVVVTNPPYIKTEEYEKLEPNVRLFEPRLALDGGEDGLSYYRRILEEGAEYIKPGGALFLEIGEDQALDVAKIAAETKFFAEAKVAKDLAGKSRMVFLKRLK